MRIAVVLALIVGLGATGSCSAFGVFGFLEEALKVVDLVKSVSAASDGLSGNPEHAELLNRFDAISDRIQGISQDVNSVIQQLKDLESAEQRRRWDLTVETLESLLRDISSNYDRFVLYQKNSSAFERSTLLDFARTAVSHDSHSLQSTMYNLRDLILGTDLNSVKYPNEPHPTAAQSRQKRYAVKQGLFRELKSLMEASRSVVCGFDKSPQQVAYSLYSTLVRALAKDFVMTEFAYMLLRLLGEGSFQAESKYFTDSYKNISIAVTVEASSVMGQLHPAFWRCDPPQHKRGATYEEVTELLQGHLENEVDLSTKNSCTGSCSDYNKVSTNRCYDATGNPHSSSAMLCERQRPCNGTLYGCRFVAGSATVCLADPKAATHRRYNWLQYSNGWGGTDVMGQKHDASLGDCDGKPSVSSWLRGFVMCSSCFCLCDDDTNSERYFSLLPVTSDVTENKIITGVRFVKLDGVFYIQVEQAEPGSLGYANASTIQWKPIDRRIDINKDVEGRDYVRLSYKKRSVLLNNLRAATGQVLTGVAFGMVGSHLTLKIRVTDMSDAATLVPSSGSLGLWLAVNDTSTAAPAPLKLPSGPVPPTQSGIRNWPDSRPGQTLTFEASSLSDDAAQTTLPLLDLQPVAPRPAVWLAGVGLFHKGQPGGGGFLGLSVQMVSMSLSEDTQKTLEPLAAAYTNSFSSDRNSASLSARSASLATVLFTSGCWLVYCL